MGFLDLFRPKWRHSDANVRAEAVRALAADDAAILKQVVQQDTDPRVRRIALKKIADAELLSELAEHDPDEGLRRDAAEKAGEMLLDVALADKDETRSLTAVDRLTAQRALSEVACKGAFDTVRQSALERLTDARALSEVARRSDDPRLRLQAVDKIDDGAVLRELAAGEVGKEVALAALDRVSDAAALEQVVRRAKNKAVRAAAKDKLEAARPRAAAPAPAPAGKAGTAAPRKDASQAEREELCRRLEVADDYDDAEEQIAMARARWQALGTLPSSDAAQKRFERAVARYLERRDVHMRKVQKAQGSVRKTPLIAPAPTPAPAPVPAPPSPEELARREAAAVARRAQEEIEAAARAAEQAERDAERKHRDEVRAKRDAERQERQAVQQQKIKEDEEKRAADQKVRSEQQQQNLVRATEQTEKLEALLAAADLKVKQAEQALKQAHDVFVAANPLPREKAQALRGRYDDARAKLVIRLHELREGEDWNRFANVPKLEALVGKVEAALAAYEEAKKAGTIVVSSAPAESAPDGKSDGDGDGAQPDAAAAPPPERIDPRDVAAYLKDLQAAWKAVGPAPKEKSEALWQRFKTASDALYSLTRAATDEERTQNLKKKEQLCERAEALRAGLGEGTDWRAVGDELKALQADWKASGPTPTKEQADALWTRFKAAADFVFDQRKARFAELDGERVENQRKKEQLCQKAESLLYSNDWKATSDLIKQLQADWKAIGPAPKEQNEALWQRFRGACDKFFERRKVAFDKQDEERAENQKKKEALCQKAEALVDKAEEDEVAAQAEIKQLQAEWKRIGPVPKEQNEVLWQRFRGAADLVFQGGRPVVPVEEAPASGEPPRKFANKLQLDGLLEKMQGGAGAGPKKSGKAARPVPAPVAAPAEDAAPAAAEPAVAAGSASAESPTWEQDTASGWEEIEQVISSGQTPQPESEKK